MASRKVFIEGSFLTLSYISRRGGRFSLLDRGRERKGRSSNPMER